MMSPGKSSGSMAERARTSIDVQSGPQISTRARDVEGDESASPRETFEIR
jgi:hypothetical protein